VGASIINAPASQKNEDKTRGRSVSAMQEGNDRVFGNEAEPKLRSITHVLAERARRDGR